MTILTHPTAERAAAEAAAPMIEAKLLFRHCGQPSRVELHPLTVDGTDYLTDGTMVVRRDRLAGVTDTWATLGARLSGDLPGRLSRALRARPSARRVRHRFHPNVVCGLYLAGAGIAVLAGRHDHDMHAIVLAGELVGLVAPLRPTDAASTLGAVPGIPAWPAESARSATDTRGVQADA